MFLQQAIWLYGKVAQHWASFTNEGHLVCSGTEAWKPFVFISTPALQHEDPKDQDTKKGGLGVSETKRVEVSDVGISRMWLFHSYNSTMRKAMFSHFADQETKAQRIENLPKVIRLTGDRCSSSDQSKLFQALWSLLLHPRPGITLPIALWGSSNNSVCKWRNWGSGSLRSEGLEVWLSLCISDPKVHAINVLPMCLYSSLNPWEETLATRLGPHLLEAQSRLEGPIPHLGEWLHGAWGSPECAAGVLQNRSLSGDLQLTRKWCAFSWMAGVDRPPEVPGGIMALVITTATVLATLFSACCERMHITEHRCTIWRKDSILPRTHFPRNSAALCVWKLPAMCTLDKWNLCVTYGDTSVRKWWGGEGRLWDSLAR